MHRMVGYCPQPKCTHHATAVKREISMGENSLFSDDDVTAEASPLFSLNGSTETGVSTRSRHDRKR
uniref:Uncharacterized protein n=1 Tax=Roseihalotalea indica TaxID=2867963 RepID=A0AA49JF71_9BACT|nr:hypothetical protein K4G66_22590 [Tunicatimonas sp. TK19036]